jgi:hypothetical protein
MLALAVWHSRRRHISPSVAAVFFLIHFSLPLFPPLLLVYSFPLGYKYLYSEIGFRNNFVTYLCTQCIYCLYNKSIKKKDDVISHNSWIFINSAARTSAVIIKYQYIRGHIYVASTVHVQNCLDGTGESEFGYPDCVWQLTYTDVWHPRRKWKLVSACTSYL